MAEHVKPEVGPIEPVTLPDVATESHPVAHPVPQTGGGDSEAGEGLLQDALPYIREAARKVGGFKRLSELAGQLGQDENGE
jgi:hypothetical protein